MVGNPITCNVSRSMCLCLVLKRQMKAITLLLSFFPRYFLSINQSLVTRARPASIWPKQTVLYTHHCGTPSSHHPPLTNRDDVQYFVHSPRGCCNWCWLCINSMCAGNGNNDAGGMQCAKSASIQNWVHHTGGWQWYDVDTRLHRCGRCRSTIIDSVPHAPHILRSGRWE